MGGMAIQNKELWPLFAAFHKEHIFKPPLPYFVIHPSIGLVMPACSLWGSKGFKTMQWPWRLPLHNEQGRHFTPCSIYTGHNCYIGPTRWRSSNDCLLAFLSYYSHGLVLKAFSGLITNSYARRLGFKTKMSGYISKIMKIFSYFRVCYSCPCCAQLFWFANWERRVYLHKSCKPVFPWDFSIQLPGL